MNNKEDKKVDVRDQPHTKLYIFYVWSLNISLAIILVAAIYTFAKGLMS